MSKYEAPSGPPPSYPSQPDAVYGGSSSAATYDRDPRGANTYYGSPPPQQPYGAPGTGYAPQQGPYQQGPYQQGPYQQGPYQQGPPPQGSYYGGPPPPQQMYYQQQQPMYGRPPQQGPSAGEGICAGIAAALACCCCVDFLF